MSHRDGGYDPLERGPESETVYDYAPTPIGVDASVATGFGSLRTRGAVYFGSASGRHREGRRRVDALLWGIRTWSVVLIVLGTGFVVSLTMDLHAPAWLRLTLACVPGICLVSIGGHAIIVTLRADPGRVKRGE